MTTLLVSVVAHEVLCAILFYTVFCRAVKACRKVRQDVRFSFFVLGTVACLGMAAPLAWGLAPDVFGLALLAAVNLVQLVTSRHWRGGVPDYFYSPGHAPRGRRLCDHQGGLP